MAVRRRAGYVKQSVLQAVGLRYGDLDPITRRLLDLYARVVGKIDLYDAWAAEHGFLQPDGSSPPWVREYYAAINSAGRLLSKLESHLERHRAAVPSPLERHLAEHYVEGQVVEVDEDA